MGSPSFYVPLTQRIFEICAVVLTGIGKFVFVDWLNLKLYYVVTAILFWVFYVGIQSKKRKGLLSYWGFTRRNLKNTFRPLLLPGLIAATSFIVYAIYKGHFSLHWHLIVIFILYPIWGIIQQFLMMSLIGGNLKDSNASSSNSTLILVTSIAFSLVHLPVVLLTVATFLLALV